MNTDNLDQLLQLMREHRLSHVSYSDGAIKVSMTLMMPKSSGTLAITGSTAAKPLLNSSSAIGTLLTAHPARSSVTVKSGDRVVAGQPLAFIQFGYSLSAVTAKVSGILGRQLVKYGQIVGYGDPIFELLPDESADMREGKSQC
ncbi:acetyl-CoA carboxylase biotin carboxyl carrier protein subunit [Chelativorans sp. SCAU2101]|uniref:Acetyl-CoA carboxylase biotin carboxyl carrier protein subunit n=1 Tax=Chelativorans petroleitrophicus TaxID=2975484 RepID=A0A9X2XB10_9HYPH|nr:acetyl-CoA carboxylase biotin carboxyl carrier protein subunit [Chelativorans petroleitrophicus]MCT8992260.1 acetyl-CoA carboxylase biotin carboxyl carrier protein subunit [Chelativorans petroleitrophicus]